MNQITPRLLAAVLALGPLTAFAQVTTLTYQSSIIEGTAEYLPAGYLAPAGTPFYGAVFPSSPFIGTLTASITLDGSLAANNLQVVSASFGLSGADIVNGAPALFTAGLSTGPAPFSDFTDNPLNFCGNGCIDLTATNGVITGATVDIFSEPYHNPLSDFQIGPSGDSVTFVELTTNGGCSSYVDYAVAPGSQPFYTGPTVNPCSLSGSSSAAGVWTVTQQAPEIDPSSGASGLALLAGALVVARGRRRQGAGA